jgi:thiosulfate/3-mercaptopyruvate sulfurtransferase
MNIQCLAHRTIRSLAGALAALLLVSAPASAQSPVPLLVDVEWVAQHLNDRSLVLLHVGTPREPHIAGARFILEEDVAKPHDMVRGDLMLELPEVREIRAKLESLGISDDSHIVVYMGKGAGVPSTTRILLTLDYVGLGDRASMLNGGLAAWQRAGKPTTTEMTAVQPGRLSARPTKPVIVDAEFVKSVGQRPNHKLVDARAAVFYNGIEPTFGKSGHIPGAVSIPFTELADNLQSIDTERVTALFRSAGVRPGDTVVAYCHIGQQATLVIFGARLLGHPVLLYDGAFQDWATANRGPVEK